MQLHDINLCALEQFEEGCPHAVFDTLRREAPVWFHPGNELAPDGEGFWVVSSNEYGREILKNHRDFSSETGGDRVGGGTALMDMTDAPGLVLAMMDPPKHDDIRGLVNQGFFPRTLDLLEQKVQALCEAILDETEDVVELDFLNQVAAELPLQVICSMAGLPREDWSKMVPWADVAIEYAAFDPLSDKEVLIEKMTAMSIYALQHINQMREQKPDESVLSQVVHATIPDQKGGQRGLDDMELMRFFSLLITGGTETTRNAIAGGFYALLQHPLQWQQLCAAFEEGDNALVRNAVDEILRYTAPVHFNRRTAVRDVHFHGADIKTGDKVTVWYGSANRDEAVFSSPHSFDISRANANKHISFGYGIHHCLGAALARMEIRLMLQAMCSRWSGQAISLSAPIRYIRSNRHQGVASMSVTFNQK